MDVADVVDVDGELDPGAPEGNDPRLVQPGAVGVDVLFEHHAGRAVQLTDHNALGAVDDERAQVGEQRKVPKVDLLLDDRVGLALLPSRLLPDDQTERRLERRREGHVALNALLDGVLGLTQQAGDILQGQIPVHGGDGKDVLKDAIKAEIPRLLGRIRVHQLPEGAGLYIQQVGHGHGRVELRKAHDRPGRLDGTVLTSQ